VSELFIPLGGEVLEVNSALKDAPETLNSDPYGAGWLIRIRIRPGAEKSTLLSSSDYDAFVASQS
jgi:glycine cleavage system H protein